MCALAAPGREGFVEWTTRGIRLAEEHDDASYWAGPLLNNLGWEYYEAGELEHALAAFERSLGTRERDERNESAIAIARYAVGKTLRGLGRSHEAIPLLEQAVAWATSAGAPDGWFHEELALEYAAVGRESDACAQGRLAIPLLEDADPSFTENAGRVERLRSLAANAGEEGA
jgi:tetratricopeptide (TPR) repeat protein